MYMTEAPRVLHFSAFINLRTSHPREFWKVIAKTTAASHIATIVGHVPQKISSLFAIVTKEWINNCLYVCSVYFFKLVCFIFSILL